MRGWCEPADAPGHRAVPEPVWRLLDVIETVPGVRERLAVLSTSGKVESGAADKELNR